MLSKNLKTSFRHLKNLQHFEEISSTPHSLGKTITLYATLQTKSLPSKGFSFSMLSKLILSKNLKTIFPHLKNLQHFEEIVRNIIRF
jgi:hypothetical protein